MGYRDSILREDELSEAVIRAAGIFLELLKNRGQVIEVRIFICF